MQQFNLVGNIAKSATVHVASNGRQAVNFRVAANDSYKDKQGVRHEKTTYYKVTLWLGAGVSTKVADSLVKGQLVRVTSDSIRANAYLDKDQKPQAEIEVTVDKLDFLGGRPNSNNGSAPAEEEFTVHTGLPRNADDDNDLPF